MGGKRLYLFHDRKATYPLKNSGISGPISGLVFVRVMIQSQRLVSRFYIGARTAGRDCQHTIGTGALVVRRHCVLLLLDG
jgi:hypothetical protein